MIIRKKFGGMLQTLGLLSESGRITTQLGKFEFVKFIYFF